MKKKEYTWQTKYVWYVVTDEGRLVHTTRPTRYGYHLDTLNSLYDSESEAVEALDKFYKEDDYISQHHILQKVYIKTSY